MSLRLKLSLVGLCLLALPWSAWRLIGTTEELLRRGEERAQLAATETLARAVAARHPLSAAGERPVLYAWPAPSSVWLDGYGDEWRDWGGNTVTLPASGGAGADPLRATVRLAVRGGTYFLLIEVTDHRIIYRRGPAPSSAPHDRLRLRLSGVRGETVLDVDTAAPGPVRGVTPDGRDVGVWGEWQETGRGYSVELRLPRPLARDGIGVAVADADGNGLDWAGTGDSDATPLAVVERLDTAAATLADLVADGSRAWLINARGWVLAAHGEPGAEQPGESTRWLRNLIYRYVLASPLEAAARRDAGVSRLDGPEIRAALDGQPATAWRAARGGSGVLVSAAQPVRAGDGALRGAIVTERVGDGVLLLTDTALVPVLGTLLAAMAVAMGALLVFAARLSGRIRRLRDAVSSAADAGTAATALPHQADRDEIGDLARGFGRTLDRLHEYTRYLRSLANRLSHELRTPLAVVTSSLENLANQPLDAETRRYAERARGGADRLGAILRAMSEAKRLEESLSGEAFERFDLATVLTPLVDAYRDLHPDHTVRLTRDAGPHPVVGSPELIAQMLDKLVDNATGFAPVGGTVIIGLARDGGRIELTVSNDGPPLPAALHEELFDSLVSVRPADDDDGGPHLGLGLHIVRLVAEAHGGTVTAADRPGGVIVRVRLPAD